LRIPPLVQPKRQGRVPHPGAHPVDRQCHGQLLLTDHARPPFLTRLVHQTEPIRDRPTMANYRAMRKTRAARNSPKMSKELVRGILLVPAASAAKQAPCNRVNKKGPAWPGLWSFGFPSEVKFREALCYTAAPSRLRRRRSARPARPAPNSGSA